MIRLWEGDPASLGYWPFRLRLPLLFPSDRVVFEEPFVVEKNVLGEKPSHTPTAIAEAFDHFGYTPLTFVELAVIGLEVHESDPVDEIACPFDHSILGASDICSDEVDLRYVVLFAERLESDDIDFNGLIELDPWVDCEVLLGLPERR